MVNELTVEPGYLRRRICKIRATTVGDPDTPRDARDNADEGGHHITLNEEVDTDASREELAEEIGGMDPEPQIELVALMWVGRGDFGQQERDEALAPATERADTPTSRYLLLHPMAADDPASGLEELGHDHILQDGAY